METPVIQLSHVDKIHRRSGSRSRSLKNLLLSPFRRKSAEETVCAARDVCLDVPKGQALGLIGMNGAGKTTLLRLIAGITEPTTGQIRASGRIIPLLELGAGFHPELSGYDNVFLQGSLFGLSRREVEAVLPDILDFAEIGNFIHTPVRHYSGGMYVRLGFAISMHMRPDILLIDETFSVGDMYFQEKCTRAMIEYHRAGGTFVLVSHHLPLIEQVCSEAAWIDHGRIVAQGKPSAITQRYKREMLKTCYPRPVPFYHLGQVSGGAVGRFGDGAVTFDCVEILDAAGNHRHVFENGEPMEFRLRYHVHGPAPEKMDCVIDVFSYRSHQVWCISTRDMGLDIRPYPAGGELRFRINRVDLSATTYMMVISLCRGGDATPAGVYDLHARIYAFDVAPRDAFSDIAAVDPPCSWEHVPA